MPPLPRSPFSPSPVRTVAPALLALALCTASTRAQETDVTQTPNPLGAGIQRSYQDQIGAGHGNLWVPDSSVFLIARDPFRSIARGRQLFQRKFTAAQGLGPRAADGIGAIATNGALGAGLSDSCASCHARPRGSAGFGGDVFTRPDSRDAPHLFGLGLVEMLADEITGDLRQTRSQALQTAALTGQPVAATLTSKGLAFGSLVALPNGTVDTSGVEGVNPDLRVRPFFADGRTISMREFVVGAFHAEMGLQAVDPLLRAAANGGDVVTPAGMHLNGALDAIEAPPVQGPWQDADHDGVSNEVPSSIVDHMEFYLLNYFKPGLGEQTAETLRGRKALHQIGCTQCHVPDLVIQHDRRVADVETVFDASQPGFNHLTATATPLFQAVPAGPQLPTRKVPDGNPFVVQNLFADFKRHDLGPNFHERNFDGTITTRFVTEPLWGVGSTAPYGHDGRSINLREVILRHGGEAQTARDAFAAAPADRQRAVLAFLESLVLFPPPDTASNLDPANPATPGFPQFGHGSIKLSVLFDNPGVPE
jgi:hypothetical protein